MRAFRWTSVDPEVRARGASRRALWGGAAVAFLWIPVAGVLLALRGRFDAVLVATLAVPYIGLPPLLEARARTPPLVWVGELGIGVGVYLLYVAVALIVVPRWRALLAATGMRASPALLLAFGVAAVAGGAIVIALYRRRVARAPRCYGEPPA